MKREIKLVEIEKRAQKEAHKDRISRGVILNPDTDKEIILAEYRRIVGLRGARYWYLGGSSGHLGKKDGIKGKESGLQGEKYNRMEGFRGCMALREKNLVNREVREGKGNGDVRVNENWWKKQQEGGFYTELW